MKDQTDDDTADMFGQKRGPGRPRTGKAKSGAARQAAYRAKQREKYVTVTINRELLERLDAQMQALRDGSNANIITPEQAGQILTAIRNASRIQLPSYTE